MSRFVFNKGIVRAQTGVWNFTTNGITTHVCVSCPRCGLLSTLCEAHVNEVSEEGLLKHNVVCSHEGCDFNEPSLLSVGSHTFSQHRTLYIVDLHAARLGLKIVSLPDVPDDFDRGPYENEFISKLRERFKQGHAEYGIGSFNKETPGLIEEIQEELLDIPDWSLMLFTRLKRLEAHILKLESYVGEFEQWKAEQKAN